jgi:hypothetical protein
MNLELRQNFEEKLRIFLINTTQAINVDFDSMLKKHAAESQLRSGNTIKQTMNMISDYDSKIYLEVISHMKALNLKFYSDIEADLLELAKDAISLFKKEALIKLEKSTEMAGRPELFQRMLPDVERDLANNLATFQNSLNLAVIELKEQTTTSPFEKGLWLFEAILFIALIFISGMWFIEPNGNYEPIMAGLSLVIPFIYLIIRRLDKA